MLCKDQYTFFISRSFLLRMRNISEKVLEKIKTRILCSVTFFSENYAFYEIMSKNIVQRDWPQMTTWRMRIACWINNITRMHPQYLILTALHHKTVAQRSQWPHGLRRRSTAARLLRAWVRIPPGAWMSVCCECFVLSGRGLCDGLITRPEASYRLWCVVVCYRNFVNEEPNINQ